MIWPKFLHFSVDFNVSKGLLVMSGSKRDMIFGMPVSREDDVLEKDFILFKGIYIFEYLTAVANC